MAGQARVVCVSLGHRGRRWVGWARAAGADVVGVVDRQPELLAAVGEELGFGPGRRFTSIGEALDELQPDAAVVCTPNETHASLARQILGAGVHLLIEKPLAEDWAEAKAIVALADDTGRQLAVAQQYRYRSGFPALRQAVVEGRLGLLTAGLVQFYRWRPTKGMKLPLLLNQAVHHFDVMRYLIGADPVSVSAQLWDPPWNGADGPTCTEATFLFPDGVRIHYSGSYVAKGRPTSFNALWRLEGSEGQLVMDGDESVVLHRPDGSETLFVREQGERSPEVRLCRDFLESIHTGQPPRPMGATTCAPSRWSLRWKRALGRGAPSCLRSSSELSRLSFGRCNRARDLELCDLRRPRPRRGPPFQLPPASTECTRGIGAT